MYANNIAKLTFNAITFGLEFSEHLHAGQVLGLGSIRERLGAKTCIDL